MEKAFFVAPLEFHLGAPFLGVASRLPVVIGELITGGVLVHAVENMPELNPSAQLPGLCLGLRDFEIIFAGTRGSPEQAKQDG
jgi:hypothetical protein